ncbi:hypothetical protein [Roseibium sp. RKSG952]|uniref:hypothetical protein n=1 Tax=Roseibium sp. RKSG952 TaxID=2529384 RepID=UPI0012BB5850|nr:hypothetical protein [Roseibium sp. RKSG952]MTH97016.1 hypothetical protein [Roseibium sp. RKSG952]
MKTRTAQAALILMLVLVSGRTFGQSLSGMTGCWISMDFNPTSLLTDASNPASAEVVREKMLLTFDQIEGTEHLVFGRIYEWDKAGTYVLGPTYQNGAFNPAANFLTFGFPKGGLDHVTRTGAGQLLYVHTKSSTKSAMAVRPLRRIECSEFREQETLLLKRQEELRQND